MRARGEEVEGEPRGAARRDHHTRFAGVLGLADWVGAGERTHLAMEATGVYWKPVWHVLKGHAELILANAAHISFPMARCATRVG